MSKDKIIDSVYRRHRIDLNKPKFDIIIVNEMMSDAMVEYAKQEAIRFRKWLDEASDEKVDILKLPTEQLYDLYLKTLNNG